MISLTKPGPAALAGLCVYHGMMGVISAGESTPTPPEERWSIHAQATSVSNGHGSFESPYQGQNSLVPHEPLRTTYTATLFLGARLWRGAEVYVNPELSGGRGLSGSVGAAGFPNGEATRIGSPAPAVYLARLFLRQSFDLTTDRETVEAAANQLGGSRSRENLTFTAGRISAADIFDDNSYSHDARSQFMNWSLMGNGAWDYPADTRGYTWGVAMEWNLSAWAIRAGSFAVPTQANGARFDHRLFLAQGSVLELERRWQIQTHPGAARLLGYMNSAHMGSYENALNQPDPTDLVSTRSYRSKFGVALNLEQELTADVGAFSRIGWNDGQSETWMFTEIDQTATLGLSVRGASWHRPDDRFGVAVAVNQLSSAHHRFLAAGGYGFIVGDGALRYGPEQIIETYYSIRICRGFYLSPGFQWIQHPGYNRDRGPVSIGVIRGHMEF
jgi:high affinity Mn2+ porin